MLLEHIKLVCRKLFIDLPQFVAVREGTTREAKGRKEVIKINSICSFPFAVRHIRVVYIRVGFGIHMFILDLL